MKTEMPLLAMLRRDLLKALGITECVMRQCEQGPMRADLNNVRGLLAHDITIITEELQHAGVEHADLAPLLAGILKRVLNLNAVKGEVAEVLRRAGSGAGAGERAQ